MQFKETLLTPSDFGHVVYDSISDGEREYRFECSGCQHPVPFLYKSLIGNEWIWEDNYDPATAFKIKTHFEMNLVGKTRDGGRPAIIEVTCANCQTIFVVYGGVQEYSNSAHKVVIQGIAKILK